jgi:hypothetical protein
LSYEEVYEEQVSGRFFLALGGKEFVLSFMYLFHDALLGMLFQVRHCIEKGILHLYVVTISTIEKNYEITISHDGTQDAAALLNSGGSPQQFLCACGNPKECMALNRRNGIHEPIE